MTEPFKLPNLPEGWYWRKLTPLSPNESGYYLITIAAVSNSLEFGQQVVKENVYFNIKEQSPLDIKNAFYDKVDSIVATVENYKPDYSDQILALTEIYQSFAAANSSRLEVH